jgi:cytidylate kinase
MMVAPALLYSDLEQSRTPGREDIISLIEQVIRAAADRGDVVIVGRGAQVVLADRPDALHVRVIAPVIIRCQRIAEREGVGAEEAMALILRADRDRARYLRQYYRVDWEDSNLYHLTVNTERTGIDLAARLIAGAVHQGLWARQEKREETSLLQYIPSELLETEG